VQLSEAFRISINIDSYCYIGAKYYFTVEERNEGQQIDIQWVNALLPVKSIKEAKRLIAFSTKIKINTKGR